GALQRRRLDRAAAARAAAGRTVTIGGGDGGRDGGRDPAATGGSYLAVPALRVAVALGSPERERRLLAALDGADGLQVAERCLAADDLLACVHAERADAVLVAFDVHRLGGDALEALRRGRLPVVLLAPDAAGAG